MKLREKMNRLSLTYIRAMLKDTKKLFISFLEMQNKAVSLRLGNKTFCHNSHSPHMNTSILSCSTASLYNHERNISFYDNCTIASTVYIKTNFRGCSSSISKSWHHKDNGKVLLC